MRGRNIDPTLTDPQIPIGKLELTISVERGGPAGVNRPSQPAFSYVEQYLGSVLIYSQPLPHRWY